VGKDTFATGIYPKRSCELMYEAYNQFTAAGEDSLCWALSTVWSHNFAIVVKLGALTYVF
jgi:hypothetical protein